MNGIARVMRVSKDLTGLCRERGSRPALRPRPAAK
jgi:hypothetical protein